MKGSDAAAAPTTPTVPTPSVTDDGIYYGTFGGCDVYFVQGPAQAEFYEEVAGYRFVHNSSFTIYALKDGVCYDLGEAYAMGLLTQEDVEELYRVHKKNETDLWNHGFLYDKE